MKACLTLATLLVAAARVAAQPDWRGYNKGVRWERSLEAALKRAAADRKPVLLHQLVGSMDKEGC